jgi:hypothetical protein
MGPRAESPFFLSWLPHHLSEEAMCIPFSPNARLCDKIDSLVYGRALSGEALCVYRPGQCSWDRHLS